MEQDPSARRGGVRGGGEPGLSGRQLRLVPGHFRARKGCLHRANAQQRGMRHGPA